MDAKMDISLSTLDKVKTIVDEVSKLEGEFDLVSGRYVVDAKSIMGIFSLDLSKPLQLVMRNVEKEALDILKKYQVENE